MKAMQIDQYGGPENLKERGVPDPSPREGQVVIQIYAASVNPIELKRASGAMKEVFPVQFPWTPGADFSGVVKTVGSGVTDFHIGDEVYGYVGNGGSYAEQIAVDAKAIAPRPRKASHTEAASLALVAQTALQALKAGGLASGMTVLIHGGSGAVGSAAVQLAKKRGAKVIATGSGDAAATRLKSFGADQFIDYKKTPFETVVKNVDIVLDTVGGETQQRSFAVLRPGGVLVALSQPPSQEEAKKHNVRALMYSTEPSGADLKLLAKEIDAGDLKPFVGTSYPLREAAKAWQDSASQRIDGKIVLMSN